MIRNLFFILLASLFISHFASTQTVPSQVDVCVYGGTSGGVIAAYTAKKMGKSVLLIEPGRHLGGMSSGGLGRTDIGNKYAITGLALDFYRRIGQHYGTFEQWIFEPHVAENIFKDYVSRASLPVLYAHRIVSAAKNGNGYLQEITLENSENPAAGTNRKVKAKMFIDATYEGDLMARAGVSYTVGREANSVYNETFNGVQLMHGHQFPDGIDPYRTPGNPESGLLWGISPAELAPAGSGDDKEQAYNFRICLTSDPSNQIPITRPERYDSTRYELLVRLFAAQPNKRKLDDYFIWTPMPNKKTDINNRGGFSTDMIGMNYRWPDGTYAERGRIFQDHVDYTRGLLYFYISDPRVPGELQQEVRKWGYPKDEYQDTGGWSPQLYVREARRMNGEYVMTQRHCEGKEVVPDEVGMAAYQMDSHNIQRLVVNGMVRNEGNVEEPVPSPFPIAYRSIIPKAAECKNLLVPVALSASHIAYGSIRMEPVFMVLGQSAAVAAVLAIDKKQPVQQVDVKALKASLKADPLADGSLPETLVDNEQKDQVRITGNWATDLRENGRYGPSVLLHPGKDAPAGSVRFTPDLARNGRYQVYFYYPRIKNASSALPISVYDGNTTKTVTLRQQDVVIEGQTSGGWVGLGTFTLPKGRKSYIEISARDADGIIAADAVLFVPER